MNYQERRVKSFVESQHGTTDSLITGVDSKLDTVKSFTDTLESTSGTVKAQTDTLESTAATIKSFTDSVESQNDTNEALLNTSDSKLDTVKGYTDGLESQNDTNESMLETVKASLGSGGDASASKQETIISQNDTNETLLNTTDSKLDTVQGFTDTVESQNDTNETLLGEVKSQNDTNEALLNTTDSKLDTIKGYTDSVESQNDTNETLLNTSDSKLDTNKTLNTTQVSKLNTLINSVSTIENQISTKVVVSPEIERPDSGSQTVRIWVYNYDGSGNMEDPDTDVNGDYEIYLNIKDSAGNDEVARVQIGDNGADNGGFDGRDGVGRYHYDWSIDNTTGLDNYAVVVDVTESSTQTFSVAASAVVEESGISGEVDSKHATTDGLITTNSSKLDTVKGYTDGLESQNDTNEVLLGTADSKLDTLKGFTDTVESQNDTNEALLNTTDSKLDTLKGFTDTVESQNDTNETLLNTLDSKLDTVSGASSDTFAQFDEAIFPKTSGTLGADGNDEEEIATSSSQQTAYNDTSIMASRIIGQGMGTKPVRFCYVDLGWNGQVTDGGGGGNGDSKFMVVAGSSATVTGAADLTDEQAETTTKTGRWRSGQIKLAAMNNLPFTVMLTGKVDNGSDTLVCKGYAASSVTVVHELQ